MVGLVGLVTLIAVGLALGHLQAQQRTELRTRYAGRPVVFQAFIEALLTSSTSAQATTQNARDYGHISQVVFTAKAHQAHWRWGELVTITGDPLVTFGDVPGGLSAVILSAVTGKSAVPGVAVGDAVNGTVPLALAFQTAHGERVLIQGAQLSGIAQLFSNLIAKIPNSVKGSRAVVLDSNGVVLGGDAPAGRPDPNGQLLAALERSPEGSIGDMLYFSQPVLGRWRVVVEAPAAGVYATATGVSLQWAVLGIAAAMFALALALAVRALVLAGRIETRNVALEAVGRELERSNSDLELLASTASHDMRSPLRRMIGFAELVLQRLKDAGSGDEKSRDYLERIVRQGRTLDGLTAALITYARVGGGEITRIALNDVVGQALDVHRVEIERTAAHIDVAPLGYAQGNAVALQEAFGNLIGNSLKFREDNKPPWIEIHAERYAGGKVHVRVRDHGIGIPAEDREKVFMPFSRLHVEHEGYGMGLAMVRRLVERMGGAVSAESPLSGPGIELVVELPEAR